MAAAISFWLLQQIFLVALAYRNHILTLRIERNYKFAATTKNWLLQPYKNAMPYFTI